MEANSQLSVRTMTVADVAFGMQLKDLEGWNQLRDDWERFLAWEPEGCFLAEYDGRPCGTTTTISYGDRFGWIGMVAVHREFRRRGIGRSLLNAALQYLDGRVNCVKLDATPMGRPLYQTLGFVDEYPLERWEGVAAARPTDGARPLSAELLDATCVLDEGIFGADRSRVLRRYYADEAVGKWVALKDGELRGYVMIRPGASAWYAGPFVASDPLWAERLLRAALNHVAGDPVYVDLVGVNPHVARILGEHGFRKTRELTRMYRGDNRYPGKPRCVYCPAGPEIG